MRPITPLLLCGVLLLAGCPQDTKTSSAPTTPAPAKSVAKTVEAVVPEKADPVAQKPQVTYFAFKG
tara:strand:- start:245 stop:442 length:198 start_codon:yes stop_codon:yes gene_type:complete